MKVEAGSGYQYKRFHPVPTAASACEHLRSHRRYGEACSMDALI